MFTSIIERSGRATARHPFLYRSRYRPRPAIEKHCTPRSTINNAFRFFTPRCPRTSGPTRGNTLSLDLSVEGFSSAPCVTRSLRNRITYRCTAHSPELSRPNRPPASSVACPSLEADELQSRDRTVLSTCCGQSTGAG